MAEIMLTCNAFSCSKKLLDQAYVTSCSHIYCTEHGGQMFKRGGHSLGGGNCTVCGSKLSKEFDCVLMDLKPTDQYKSIILNGLNPDQIMDIAGRAISFFTYQMNFETQLKENVLKNIKRHSEEACISITQSYKGEILKIQTFAESLKKELEEKMREVEMQKQKVIQLARENKQLQSKIEGYKRERVYHKANINSGNEREQRAFSPLNYISDTAGLFEKPDLRRHGSFFTEI